VKEIDKIEVEEKAKKAKAEAERAAANAKAAEEERIRIAAHRKQQKETFMDPYKGGTIRVGRGETWNYAADGIIFH